MRARSLKPGLFKNELLGSADPLLTILFEGLWCSADREGRLEDRPLRICAEVFPYRRAIKERKTDAMLQWLHDRKFITRYEVDGDEYIQVLEFKRHQNPHIKEGPSKIPELRLGKPRARNVPSTGTARDEHEASLVPVRSDSGLRTPDSGLRTPYMCADPSPVQAQGSGSNGCGGHETCDPQIPDPVEEHQHFERVMAVYPKFVGAPQLLLVEKACRDRIAEGSTWGELEDAVKRFAKFVKAGARSNPKYVETPLNFFSSEKWRDPWTPPPTKDEARVAGNIDETEEWLRERRGVNEI